MPLKLSLKPGEAIVVNGAVVRNGERRGVLLLETQARVLRERDILQPEDARTPVEHAYFSLMQMYLVGETEGSAYDQAVTAFADLMEVSKTQAERDQVLAASRMMASGDLYQALGHCRKMMRDPNAGVPDE